MSLKIDTKFGEELTCTSSEHFKVWKLGLSWYPFVQSRKCMSLKFTGELCAMTVKNDGKIVEELTYQWGTDLSVQNRHEEFDEFWPEHPTQHSKIANICTLMGCFWPNYVKFELEK